MLVLTQSTVLFHQRTVEQREALLLSWKASRIATLRRIYDSMAKLGNSVYMRSSDLGHKAMCYQPTPTESLASGHYPFKFSTTNDLDNVVLDAIIVGSGSGGGVVAKMLAEAGLKVLVIEKGQHFDLAGPAFTEAQSLDKMYDAAAVVTNDYGDVALVSGKTFGGGSAVNWAASLQPPASVRRDWATTYGLPYFQTTEFQSDLDAVFEQMGVSQPTSQNVANSLLLEGARRLGFQHAAVPQNNGNGVHLCNHDCANGCRSGGKKGGVHSWLVDAAKAGAYFMEDASVRSIIFGPKHQATGVILRFSDGREATLMAPRIVVAGGSIESPALLLRSKVPNNRVGQSIYLHPTNYLYAVMPQRTFPTDGQILTSVVGEYANLTPSGHGVRIETGIMQPGIGMSLLQWMGGAEHKARLTKHSHMAGLIAICRDRNSGKVRLDANGEAIVDYTVSPFDSRSIVTGTIAGAECMKEMGAEEIIVAARGVPSWKKGEDFDAWKRIVNATPPGGYGSAHQMASNRMAATASQGACDPNGALYGVQGVWVADASVLPSASGVNPMISTMAVARKVGRSILEDAQPAKAKL